MGVIDFFLTYLHNFSLLGYTGQFRLQNSEFSTFELSCS